MDAKVVNLHNARTQTKQWRQRKKLIAELSDEIKMWLLGETSTNDRMKQTNAPKMIHTFIWID